MSRVKIARLRLDLQNSGRQQPFVAHGLRNCPNYRPQEPRANIGVNSRSETIKQASVSYCIAFYESDIPSYIE